jgi:CheY-like chemotaxis protein
VAGDGVKVLAALETKFYDIVLMDVQLPNMDGIETTRQIMERFGIENSPVIIALTAGALPGDRKRCMKAGMHDFMTKPIRPKQLKAVLDHWQQKLEQI